MAQEKYADNLSLPFERAETEEQKRLHEQIRQLCKQDFVVQMTYPELFDVLDRIKLTFQLDMCKRLGMIKYNIKKKKV